MVLCGGSSPYTFHYSARLFLYVNARLPRVTSRKVLFGPLEVEAFFAHPYELPTLSATLIQELLNF